jgi:ABC-2 type transport system permease protein
MILTVYTLLMREIIRFYRQPNRVVGALLQPLIFWVLIGSGMNASFRLADVGGISYMEYFYPGILLMILLFTSIFSTITIIEDRRDGFLQGVLVAPVPRAAIVIGKSMGGTLLGMIQCLIFLLLLLTPMVDIAVTLKGLVTAIIALTAAGFGMTALGVLMAWSLKSTQEYHALMSVLLFPMWLFSGAAFPVEGAPGWLKVMMQVNPLTHALALIRRCLYDGADVLVAAPAPVAWSLTYAIVAGGIVFLLALRVVRRG